MKRVIHASSNKEEVVSIYDVNFCPFCGHNQTYSYEPTKGVVSCPQCDAIFKVVEHPDSTRFFQK